MILLNGEPLPVTWTATSRWRAEVELEGGENSLVFIAFDVDGNIVGSDSIVVTSAVGWPSPEILTITPDEALAGTVVTLTGGGFHDGVDVVFGSRVSPSVDYAENGPTPDTLTAVVPDGSGTVDVRARNVDGRESNALPFTYPPPPPSFVRGDANEDGLVDLSDAVKIVFALFGGQLLGCEDAADVDDSEALDITDAIYLLDFLYREGSAPPAPFPGVGPDPSGEVLDCENG